MATQNSKLFGTAVFGGFNKQDVLSYIEFTANEFNQALKKYNVEIEQLRSQKNELKAKIEALNDEISTLNAKLSKTSGDDQALNDRINSLTYENARLSDENTKLSTENLNLNNSYKELTSINQALTTEIDVLKAKEQSIEAVKLHLADIEISAYQRADQIEKEIEKKKAKALEDIATIISRVKNEFEKIKLGVEISASGVIEELDGMQKSVLSIPDFFNKAMDKFDSVFSPTGSFVEESAPPKQLSPLPLVEENQESPQAANENSETGSSISETNNTDVGGENAPTFQAVSYDSPPSPYFDPTTYKPATQQTTTTSPYNYI